MNWRETHNIASPEQIKLLQDLPGSPHVTYGCNKCGCGTWSAKNLTLSDKGHFVSIRNIFYQGDTPECLCTPDNLVCIVPKTQHQIETEERE